MYHLSLTVSLERSNKKIPNNTNNANICDKKRGLALYALNLWLVIWSQLCDLGITATCQLFLELSTDKYCFGAFGK